jgi:hypothetical protein
MGGLEGGVREGRNAPRDSRGVETKMASINSPLPDDGRGEQRKGIGGTGGGERKENEAGGDREERKSERREIPSSAERLKPINIVTEILSYYGNYGDYVFRGDSVIRLCVVG